MSNKDQQPETTSSPPPQEASTSSTTTEENNNLSPEQIAEINIRNTKAKQQEPNIAKDNQGNVNVSRGIIGLKSSPSSSTTKSYITEGTIADSVNAPSKFPNAEGIVNPLSEQDLQDRISMERAKAGLDKEYQQQLMIKIRTEAQNFNYKPEGKWADAEKYPELKATEENLKVQAKEPTINSEQGEQLLTAGDDEQQQQQQQQEQQ